MTRLLRLVLATALVSAAACSGGTPTAPPAPNMLTPEAEALMSDGDSTCRSGFGVTNGRSC
jgi:hypothetical protein